MPEIEIFMDDVPNQYTVLDETKLYLWRISSADLRKTGPNSKAPGEPMINVGLEVREPAEWEGKVCYINLNLPQHPTPLDSVAERRRKLERGVKLRQFMEAFKLTWGPKGFKTEDWIGAEAGGQIKNEPDLNGDMRSNPKRFCTAEDARLALEKLSAADSGGDPTGATVGVSGDHGI